MANTKSSSLGPGLSTAERVAGFCYLPFYAVLLAVLLPYGAALLGLRLTELQLNLCFFVINVLMVWLIFHNFLLRSLRMTRFWELIQAVILGFALYYAGNYLLNLILHLLRVEVASYNDDTVLALATDNFWIMAFCSVILAPIVEETLVRGLVFGVIRRGSRITAYVVTILFFAFLHVWQYFLLYDAQSVLLAAIPYLPAGIALGWTYEKANTIWAPICLHMMINALAFGVMQLV